MPELTINQQDVIKRLRKAQLDWIADATEREWKRGKPYYIDSRVGTPKGVRRAFKVGNKEAKGVSRV